MALSRSDRDALLHRARAALVAHLRGEVAGIFDDPPALRRHGTGFVSVYVNDRLRGCRGRMIPREPLGEAIAQITVLSATDDKRFVSLTATDVAVTRLVIQVLTPSVVVAGPEEIALGRHGIVLAKAGRSAVFLPNVAPDFGWDLETALSRLAEKAGLRHDDWRRGATFEVFESEVIDER